MREEERGRQETREKTAQNKKNQTGARQREVIGGWWLAVGSWQLAVGSWQLAVGSWQLAVKMR